MRKGKWLVMTALSAIIALSNSFLSHAAWVETEEGRWWYSEESGSGYSVGWKLIGEDWYYFDMYGWMQTGWIQDNGSDYYLAPTGEWIPGKVKEESGYTDNEIYRLLIEHYKSDSEETLTVMEGLRDGGRYSTQARCGVPGNATASQPLYFIDLEIESGAVKEENVISGQVSYYSLY